MEDCMIKICCTILFIFVLANTYAQKILPRDSSNIYKVIKIDTIKNINVLFAQKNELTYKIILVQDSFPCLSNSIKIGQYYNLLLKSVFPDNYLQRDRISALRYGSIRIYLEKDNGIVWDLFYILNLKDLCPISTYQNGWDLITTNVVASKTE